MSEKLLKIRYRCQHPSCQIKVCREGEITIEESKFLELSAAYEDDDSLFKSPRGICRLGFPQPFKVITEEDRTERDVEDKKGRTPVEILKEEHRKVLENLEIMEDQMSKRDIEGLWITTARVEDEITLHSIEKEEGILFPLMKKISPLTEGHLTIMQEDHRELMAFLHSFREGLREGDILDGVANSLISNLRSHIKKEDNEFFDEVEKTLNRDDKQRLLKGMELAEEKHVTVEPGERRPINMDDEEEARKRQEFKEALMAAKKAAEEDHCH